MIGFEDYARHDGLGLAERVRRRELSATELLDAALARLQAIDPALNAVVRRRDAAARTEAARIDADLARGDEQAAAAPFVGVPYLLKDLIATHAGEPTGHGTRLLANLPMPQDSELVRRLRAAGLVIAARTNTPEFGLTPVTEPALYGPTRNPWALDRSAGGSSGGSAAAVAARIVPMASGGDGGGSIRIPASCCGLFGLKPSRGRVPTGPAFGEIWDGLAVEHAITRTVRDSAALLDASAGADAGAPYAAPPQARPFVDEVATEPGRLRIAFSAQTHFGSKVHPDCVAAMRDAADLLASLGHEVEEAALPVEREAWSVAFVTVLAAQTRAQIEAVAAAAGVRVRAADFEPATYALGLLGRSIGASRYAAARHTLQMAARKLAPFFARHDLLLTPTLGSPPPLIGALQPKKAELRAMRAINAAGAGWLLDRLGVVGPLAERSFDFIPFTPLFNVTGQPAMSVPLWWNEQGLPIGVQLVGRFGDEATLLRVAGQLERARPWADRVPPAV
jgi:amidase